MDALQHKPGLDPSFRKYILNKMINRLKELSPNAENPEFMSKLHQTVQNYEEKVYSESTDKNDYLATIQRKMRSTARRMAIDASPAPMGVNQKQANEPQVLQKPLPVSLPTMQPGSVGIQSSSNQIMQDHQTGHQSVSSSVQQHWPMKEQRSMSVTDFHQQPSQLLSPSVISQEQRNRIQDVRLQGTHMPSTSLHCQTIVGDNKHSLLSSTMQPRSISIQPSTNQLIQDQQTRHQSVSSSVQQHWPMKEQCSMSVTEIRQQPSQLLSPSVISQGQRDRIQDARLQGTHMPSTSLHCQTVVGNDKHSFLSPTMQPRSISIQPFTNQLIQDHQTGHQSVSSSVQQHWPMKEQHSMSISRGFQQPSQLRSPSVISQGERDQIQGTRLQRAHMPSTSLQCQTLVGQDKYSLQSPTMKPSSNHLIQDHQTGNQTVSSSVQQHLPMNEQRFMPISESCQQPSQLLSQSVISKPQRGQIQDARLQGTHMPSTSLQCRTLAGEDKHSLQSPMIRSSPSSALGPLPDADWKLLIDQFKNARSRYLTQLMIIQKIAEDDYLKAKTERARKAVESLRSHINLLTAPERELMIRFSKEYFSKLLKSIIFSCDRIIKKFITSAGNRKPQPSDGQSCLDSEPTTPTVNTALISQPSAQNFSSRSDVLATKQVDKNSSLLHQSPEGTHLNVKEDPRPSHSSSEKQPRKLLQSRKQKQLPADPMNSMFPSMSKRPKRPSAKSVQTKNASRALKPSAKSEPKETNSDRMPLTPITPSSAPKEIGSDHLPLTPITPSSAPKETDSDHLPLTPITPSSAPKETDSDHLPLTPITPSSAPKEIDSDHLPLTPITPSSAPKEIENPSKQPLERLTQVIQSMSKEALRSSIDGIASAMKAVDMLPYYAKCPNRNIKRNIDSLGGYVSTMDYCNSSAKRSRTEIDHSLIDEIREINQRLIETVIEVERHSDSDSRNGTIIKCTYTPLSFTENFNRHFISMTSLTTLSIKFLVPSNYPYSSPEVLDPVPAECCPEKKELMDKVKSRFDRRARSLVSLSLGDLVHAWDDSVRSVFSEVAVCVGGESFSSKYGTWECVPAA